MTSISSRDFNQRVSEAKKAAQHGPVFITHRGKPQHVLLSMAEYQKLTGQEQSIAALLAEPNGVEFDAPRLDDLAQAADFS